MTDLILHVLLLYSNCAAGFTNLTLIVSSVCLRNGQRHHPVAVPAAVAAGPESQAPDMLDVNRWRVQASEVRGSGQAVGAT